MKELSPKQLRYVQWRVLGNSCAEAARKAGYAEHYARRAADYIEAQKPQIRTAIETAREKIRQETVYDGEKLINQVVDTIKFAREHKNPMAAMKGLELIAKLTGLLVERIAIEYPSLTDALAQARGRVSGGAVKVSDLPRNETPAITGPLSRERIEPEIIDVFAD